ncbi:hypothetical protein B4129_1174 [Bacillus safensis]|nr:hypothetical protein B4129_1174 [Bacillus safensis]
MASGGFYFVMFLIFQNEAGTTHNSPTKKVSLKFQQCGVG